MDEVHFQQHGSRCRMWVPPEVADPICRHAPTRKSISYFGAVRLKDGKLVMSPPDGMFDARTCWTFYRRIERIAKDSSRKIVMIIDNARYHHATLHEEWRREVANHFALHFLPPYSPELNPIERVWKLTRRMATHNRYFPTLTAVISSVENVFSQWHTGNDTLRRICAI
jgi:transposase